MLPRATVSGASSPWLAERGLVSIEEIGGVMIAALSESGHDAQAGAAEIPGVRRPGPGAT